MITLIDDEIREGKTGKLTVRRDGRASIPEKVDGEKPLEIPVRIAKVVTESDGWIKEIVVLREDDPNEIGLLCVRLDHRWISRDGLVVLDT
jgi:hypothetical protein